MTEKSSVWSGELVGDASIAPYDALEWQAYWGRSIGYKAATHGVYRTYLHMLNATGAATPVVINTGGAMVTGCDYENTTAVNVVVLSPGVATRIDRIVLRRDTAAQTTRITKINGVEGTGVPPAITQVAGGTWDLALWQVSITTLGVITLIDERYFIPELPLYSHAGGRLTLTSLTPVTTADVSAAATLYYTNYKDNRITIINSYGVPQIYYFTNPSLSLAGYTALRLYDIFAYDVADVVTLSSLIWTNTTTRATALSRVQGINVLSTDVTKKYLGTICMNAAGTTDDKELFRFVWNNDNRVPRKMRLQDTTASWVYNGVMRQMRATATNQLEFVIGLSEDAVRATNTISATSNAGQYAEIAIGLDSTTTQSADSCTSLFGNVAGLYSQPFCSYNGYPNIGWHRLVPLERGVNCTFWGSSTTNSQLTEGTIFA